MDYFKDFDIKETSNKLLLEFLEAFVSLFIIACITTINSDRDLNINEIAYKIFIGSIIVGSVTTMLEKYDPSYEKTFKNNILVIMSSVLLNRLVIK
jgi:glycerol uptake facilitator-like aquaporin